MPYVLPDGRRVAPERAFTLNDIQYPRNWLKLAGAETIAALSITWEADPAPPAPVEPALADVKAQLSRQVDIDAEVVRLKYITPGDGQIMTYNEKHAQARAVLTLGDTAANALTEAERDEQFPTLSASVGLEAETLFACAQLVVSRYEAFADLSRVIERTRLAGKKAISDASDNAGARAAYAGITWTV